MFKHGQFFLLLLLPCLLFCQDGELPPDFRQHNLTEYNSSLLSPIYSLDRSPPRSLALWTRWQWQTVDGDPTTILFNYTHRINPQSAAGLGFFQHNTGLFLQTGAVLNYAYDFDLGGGASVALGLNSFLYQRKPSDDIFQINPDFPLPQFDVSNDFILQLAPSLRFKYEQFSVGVVGENLVDYNFTTSEQETSGSDKIIIGLMSYQFPVYIFGNDDSYVQPTIYLKTLPGMDDQYGITGLFSTPRFWAQLGYNSFYGASGGVGGRFFKDFSIGALLEFGSENSFQGSDTSIEFVTAYRFGEGDPRRRVVGFDVEEEAVAEAPAEPPTGDAEEVAAAEARQVQDSIARANRAREVREQQLMDSIAEARQETALAAAREIREARERDSLDQVARAREEADRKLAAAEKVTPKPGEKYEETRTIDGLVPGYYLITNVFGTKKYFEAFMKTLDSRGLQPKSFYRSVNKYNYVYLQRYDSIEEARAARDSKFNGRYTDPLWIFRVVGE